MPFGAHETMEVHEILNEKINMINHFSLYAQMCQDNHIRQMIERHMQTAIQSYDQMVSYTHDYNAASGMKRTYNMPNVQPQNIQYGLRDPMQQMPQTQGKLNDQQILMAVLDFHKNSARNHIHASLECADPNVRQMLVNGAVNCSNQAYEVFLFMNQHGYYQVPTMNDHTAKTFLHSYQPMNESSMMAMGQSGQGSSMGHMGNMGSMQAGAMNSQRQMSAMNSNMSNMAGQMGTSGSTSMGNMHGSMNTMNENNRGMNTSNSSMNSHNSNTQGGSHLPQ